VVVVAVGAVAAAVVMINDSYLRCWFVINGLETFLMN
jgi:hypothetical protein